MWADHCVSEDGDPQKVVSGAEDEDEVFQKLIDDAYILPSTGHRLYVVQPGMSYISLLCFQSSMSGFSLLIYPQL